MNVGFHSLWSSGLSFSIWSPLLHHNNNICLTLDSWPVRDCVENNSFEEINSFLTCCHIKHIKVLRPCWNSWSKYRGSFWPLNLVGGPVAQGFCCAEELVMPKGGWTLFSSDNGIRQIGIYTDPPKTLLFIAAPSGPSQMQRGHS